MPIFLQRLVSAINVGLFRLTGGRVGGAIGKARILLLHTTGRTSQKDYTTPLLYLEDGPDLVIVASNGGRPRHPSWWLNLQANPETTVELREGKRTVVASEATPEETERLWPRLVEMYRSYDSYKEKTSRQIPVVLLKPA